ncbi:trans-aconitate 2-methyltransferase [Streptomyces sp. UNOC14_S4]|uniref:trans-aconitate 2-methyltransferase n=1 Tax=Streptomyces sp. UNOC14_S4 TaxID=2872340 RepID=UPI001E5D706C|nr:trans-aconitate 2-methyltransferase [Streptomyces sp. UNOC14_S4]MCC3772467.1 trans-aconitate 2-methyltransferase [Streptomyces sp. UNOC14_S4]
MDTTTPTWDPEQYLRHAEHRTRPVQDLLARVPELPGDPGRPLRIVDLGCGAGNLTPLLTARWPEARITGLDSSAEMLAKAAAYAGDRVSFARADLADWAPAGPYDLIFSSATLQWIPGHAELFPAWLAALAPGGVLAFTIPGNFDAPSHALLRDLCESPRWRPRLGPVRHGHALEPGEYLERLSGLGLEVDAWETTYVQLLHGPDPVLSWTKGTALRPVLSALPSTEADVFLTEYGALLREAYPEGPHGTVFPFRRIFVVARKGD